MSTRPSQSESNAMAAILHGMTWVEWVEWIQKQMQQKDLAGGSKDEQTKNEGAVE